MSDDNRGIYEKYEVRRLNDPTGKHSHCNYFVLDLVHDEFALPALKAYAKACKKKFPQLSSELQTAVDLASAEEGRFFPTSLDSTLFMKMRSNK